MKAVPKEHLEAEVEQLADRLAMIDPDLLSANKRIVNLGLELMGARTLQRLAAGERRARPQLGGGEGLWGTGARTRPARRPAGPRRQVRRRACAGTRPGVAGRERTSDRRVERLDVWSAPTVTRARSLHPSRDIRLQRLSATAHRAPATPCRMLRRTPHRTRRMADAVSHDQNFKNLFLDYPASSAGVLRPGGGARAGRPGEHPPGAPGATQGTPRRPLPGVSTRRCSSSGPTAAPRSCSRWRRSPTRAASRRAGWPATAWTSPTCSTPTAWCRWSVCSCAPARPRDR